MRQRVIIGLVAASLSLPLLRSALPVWAAAPSPSSVNLTLSDMPAGFKQLRGDTLSNSDVARQTGQSVATIDQQGRLLTSYVEFQRAGGAPRRLVISQVALYATTADARTAYLAAVAGDAHARSITFTAVGTARTAFSIIGTRRRKPLAEDIVDFYRGQYATRLVVAGNVNSLTSGEVSHLAGTIDGRITAQ